jgi:S1-C subfamily serine protease
VGITAALVLPDMTVRPLPLVGLELVAESDTAARTPVRTGLEGRASVSVLPGRYRLRSLAPVSLNDSTYQWDVAIEVAVAGAAVELTNANALVVANGRTKSAARQVAPEREVFEGARRAVFRVEAGLGHGSGFLADVPGASDALVITNDHVVANSTTASVYLDSVTRVPAQVVVRDREADLALLRIAPARCADCPRLTLSTPPAGEALAVAGERVLAIGFPLNQEMTLTTGIASSIRNGAIISDVNINHGNSGGPMLNLAGEVIGVNAFGDFTSQGGPGISGAIAITRIAPLLARVPDALASLPPAEDRLLPVAPQATYPLAILKSVADTANAKEYRKLLGLNAGKFTVAVITPVMYQLALRLGDDAVARDRRKREQRGNVNAEERYSEASQIRDWAQYVGVPTAPVVTVEVTPKVGETFGSALGRGLQAAAGSYVLTPATMKFQGDVRGVRFYRNGIEVEPIRGGHGPQAVQVDNQWVNLKDVADRGYYVLSPDTFAPDSNGAPARVLIVVQDLKNPGSLSTTEIEGERSARLWNDFIPYFQATHPAATVRWADPKQRSPKMQMTCDVAKAACEPSL